MRKSCKRVKRIPGHLLIETQVQRIVTPLHISLTLLPAGLFTREHADQLAKVINIVFVSSDETQIAHKAANDAGDVLCSMFERVNAGKSWNVTVDERNMLMKSIVHMDHHVRRMTTSALKIAAVTVDTINAEAKAKGYGFLDKAPVVSSNKIAL